MNGRPWTEADWALLKAEYRPDKATATAVAKKLGRGLPTVRSHARSIGIASCRHWSEIEDRRLRNGLAEVGIAHTARRLGRTRYAVFNRARLLGYDLGCPPGFEYVAVAARRSGFAPQTLEKILRWAGVKMRLSLAEPRKDPRLMRMRKHIVDQLDVDDAVAAWLATETPAMAGRRLGCNYRRIVRALLASGEALPPRTPGQGYHWRVSSELIDRVMADRMTGRDRASFGGRT